MFLQGNLQNVFDALYTLGAIDPALQADWQKMNSELGNHMDEVYDSFRKVNSCSDDFSILLQEMGKMNTKTLQYLAMEVAREFCEYQDRSALH
ncbi:MAG: cytochrome [Bdellovibrionaceae bacterium]|nr:cytochrome [Pseudobdellovibrionaceae bacterium]